MSSEDAEINAPEDRRRRPPPQDGESPAAKDYSVQRFRMTPSEPVQQSDESMPEEGLLHPWDKKAHKNSLSNALRAIGDKSDSFRGEVIAYTPGVVIRNSGTFISLMHVVAEALMLKAAGITFMKNTRDGGRVNILIDPARNLYRGITGADKVKALQNQWSTRSTTAGFSTWVLGSLIPDKKEAEEKKEAQQVPSTIQDPFSYAGQRLYEATQIGNKNTKRQQIGLGVTVAGIFSAISGFNNVNVKTGGRFTNWTHAIGGGITALAGSRLLFAKTDQQGWEGLGTAFWLRLPLAAMSTYRKYTGGDRWGYYLAGQCGFQAAAVLAYLIGGAEKEKETDEKDSTDAPSYPAPKEGTENTPDTEIHKLGNAPDRLGERPEVTTQV